MSPYPAGPRRHLATSPFNAPDPEPPAERFAVDDKVDFLRRQVLTSRNIRGSVLNDLALGGLNYQIEHHLFPSMPRPSLRHAQAPVRAFCAQRGIPYSETGLLASYAQVLRHLHTTGQTAGPGTGC